MTNDNEANKEEASTGVVLERIVRQSCDNIVRNFKKQSQIRYGQYINSPMPNFHLTVECILDELMKTRMVVVKKCHYIDHIEHYGAWYKSPCCGAGVDEAMLFCPNCASALKFDVDD